MSQVPNVMQKEGRTTLLEELRKIVLKHGFPCAKEARRLNLRPYVTELLRMDETQLKLETIKVLRMKSSLTARQRPVCLLLAEFMSEREAIAARVAETEQAVSALDEKSAEAVPVQDLPDAGGDADAEDTE